MVGDGVLMKLYLQVLKGYLSIITPFLVLLFVHGANSLLTSGFLLENVKSMYGDIMEFLEIPGAAHHVPLDKPREVIKLIKERCG
jgi:hypothetical protein